LTAKLLTLCKGSIRNYTLVPASGGCFEVTVGGKLVYSKLKTGEFPEEDELVKEVARLVGA
jgi:selenoprotein W-related protein